MPSKRLVYVVNDLPFFVSHRLALAIQAAKEGFEVHIATPQGTPDFDVREADFIYHSIMLSRRGINPLKEVVSIVGIYRLLRKLKPDIVHLITIKPILYGGLMARLLKIPAVVAAVSGLGTAFIANSKIARMLRKVINQAYKQAFKHSNLKVIFQNEDDQQLLMNSTGLSKSQTIVVRGSGVEISKYRFTPENKDQSVVLMISRLIKDKGVMEYVAAAKLLKAQGVQAQFYLVGDSDNGNPGFINDKYLAQWEQEKDVELLGYREDIPELMATANLIVLPSYREGLPKVLIEAASCGRAVVTTDVPGCRDAIEPNQSGLLVPVKDVNALANAIKWLIENPEVREQYGKAGREFAEREFTLENIVNIHMQIYKELELRS